MAYQVDNPLGINNLEDIFKVLSGRILEIVIPIAVLLYIWAGVQMLIAAGRPKFVEGAKTTFKYTTIGLVVIFIGGGFVSLIRNILNAGSTPAPATNQSAPPASQAIPLVPAGSEASDIQTCSTTKPCAAGFFCGPIGTCQKDTRGSSACTSNADCFDGLNCSSSGTCVLIGSENSSCQTSANCGGGLTCKPSSGGTSYCTR